MAEHTQFTFIKNREFNMPFYCWINYIKLRFQTRQWASSLDTDSYVIHHSNCGTNNGITVEFPFSLSDDTFTRRMGTEAMSTIYKWWREVPQYTCIDCPDSDGWPDETYWVFIMNQDFDWDFYSWVSTLEQYFDENHWEHNIDNGHEIIRDKYGDEVGIYVTMPYAMTFSRFLERMEGKLHVITYVTKTTHDMDEDELTACHTYGFFDQMDGGEFY